MNSAYLLKCSEDATLPALEVRSHICLLYQDIPRLILNKLFNLYKPLCSYLIINIDNLWVPVEFGMRVVIFL